MANYSPNFRDRQPSGPPLRTYSARPARVDPEISGPLYRPFDQPTPTGDDRLTGNDQELVRRQIDEGKGRLYGGGNIGQASLSDPNQSTVDAGVQASVARSPYDKALEDLKTAQGAPVEESRGKSAAYGAANAASQASRSGSLGYTAGAALTGALSGLLNKRLYGSAKKKASVDQAEDAVATQGEIEKRKQESEKRQAETEQTRAQTVKTRKETEEIGKPKPEDSELKSIDGLMWNRDKKTGKLTPANHPETGKQLTDEEYSVDPTSGVVYNKRTGKKLEGAGLPRAVKITDDDIPDERFGLPKPDEIKRAARASVSSSMKQRRMKPEVAANLPAALKNSDGTVNELKLWDAISSGKIDTGKSDKYGKVLDDFKLSPSEVYEQWTDRDDQALAQAEQREEAKYSEKRKMVSDLRTRIKHNTPRPEAQDRSLADVLSAMDGILEIKDKKERSKKYQDLMSVLPYLNIR